MQTIKLQRGNLEINRKHFPITCYLAIYDEGLLEYRISQIHKMAGGTLDMTAVNIEHDLAHLGANENLQIARDWLNKKTSVDAMIGGEGYESEDGNTFYFK